MDSSHQQPGNNSPAIAPAGSYNGGKRPLASEDEPPSKKIRPSVEIPAMYSDAVRKKLASTSRTGQACDRCKERKMKCDTNPIACQPCRQKNLRCYTTDRVTGQSRERGQTDRAETELQILREQNAAYQRKYGPLEAPEYRPTTYSPAPDSANDRSHHLPPPPERDKSEIGPLTNLPNSQYVGWPPPLHCEPLQPGPVDGTHVDILDGSIDIADFPCETMDDYSVHNLNIYNMSRSSIINTLTGYQNITDPRFPSKEQALQDANTFVLLLGQFVPILHKPSFLRTVNKIYDQPDAVTQSERVQLAVVLAMVEQQMALRNHREAAEKFEASHHHFHYALTYYRELLREGSLASMQALALMLVHFRNLPKPGCSWWFAHNALVVVMNAEYHRDPDKIRLPPQESNILAKELRKRVFHSILGICITTGCRVGRPAPWQFCHVDVPLPMAILDEEISENGLATPLSGSCDFWPCLQLAKLLPLMTELYNNVTSVRRTEREYLRTVEILHSKIDAWRRDWDESIKNQDKQVHLNVATLLVETWAAEYTLNLYHPSVCPTRSSEIVDRHLEICHKQAQRLLKSFHILSGRYKGVDFTWHSTVAYALGFGVTLSLYRRRKGLISTAQFDAMKNELNGWMSLMAYADLVLRTRNHLQHLFEPRVKQLENEYQDIMRSSPSEPNMPQTTTLPPSGLPNRPYIKADPSPRPSPLGLGSNGMDVRPNAPQQEVSAIHYNQTPTGQNSQQWPSASHYAPRPGSKTPTYVSQGGSATPTYPAYVTSAPQYSPLPTSLAPILNDQSGGYMTYSPTTNPQQEMMIFHPGHYTESSGTMMWPMITLPPQEQGQQHGPNNNMKFQ